MAEDIWEELRTRSVQIDARWAALLRGEPVNTPLAQPDSLGGLIPWTRDEILACHIDAETESLKRVCCACGKNPLLAFFAAGEQALLETLVLIQAEAKNLDAPGRDLAFHQLQRAIRHIARREVNLLCRLCPRAKVIAASQET